MAVWYAAAGVTPPCGECGGFTQTMFYTNALVTLLWRCEQHVPDQAPAEAVEAWAARAALLLRDVRYYLREGSPVASRVNALLAERDAGKEGQ